MPAEENSSPKTIVAGPQPQSMSTLWPVSQRFAFFPTPLHTTWHLQPYTITDFSLDLWVREVEGRLQIAADSILNIQSESWAGVKASLSLKNVPPSFKPAFLNLLHTWQQSESKNREICFSGNPGTLSQLHRSCSFLLMLSVFPGPYIKWLWLFM